MSDEQRNNMSPVMVYWNKNILRSCRLFSHPFRRLHLKYKQLGKSFSRLTL
jgi:hypothetical protein